MVLKKNEIKDTKNRDTVKCKTWKIQKLKNDWNKEN